MNRTYEISFPVRLHDVDAAGIVFFARYFVLMHDVYESFLAHIGQSIAAALRQGDVIIPVVESHARYRRPMRHGETITAKLNLAALEARGYTVRVALSGPDGVLRAVLTTRHVCVDAASMRPAPLPAGLKAALAGYLHADPEEGQPPVPASRPATRAAASRRRRSEVGRPRRGESRRPRRDGG